jgi:hypothetical protein
MRWTWVCMGGGTTPANTSVSMAAAAASGGGSPGGVAGFRFFFAEEAPDYPITRVPALGLLPLGFR